MSNSIIRLENITLVADGQSVCENLSYEFPAHKLIALKGEKEIEVRAFLKLMAGILEPENGDVIFEGESLYKLNKDREKFLHRKIGYIFRIGGLISNLTISENLLLPFDNYFPEISHEEKLSKLSELFSEFSLDEKILTVRPAEIGIQTNKLLLFIRTYLYDPTLIFYEDPAMILDPKKMLIIVQRMTDMRDKNIYSQFFFDSSEDLMFGIADEIHNFENNEFKIFEN